MQCIRHTSWIPVLEIVEYLSRIKLSRSMSSNTIFIPLFQPMHYDILCPMPVIWSISSMQLPPLLTYLSQLHLCFSSIPPQLCFSLFLLFPSGAVAPIFIQHIRICWLRWSRQGVGHESRHPAGRFTGTASYRDTDPVQPVCVCVSLSLSDCAAGFLTGTWGQGAVRWLAHRRRERRAARRGRGTQHSVRRVRLRTSVYTYCHLFQSMTAVWEWAVERIEGEMRGEQGSHPHWESQGKEGSERKMVATWERRKRERCSTHRIASDWIVSDWRHPSAVPLTCI